MLRLKASILCFAAAAWLAAPAAQAVPNLISYQGQLNDQNGVPVNGTVSFVFSIYNVPTGGTALWTEPQTISVSNGIFNVQLGAVTTLPSSVFATDVLYLGIKAGADAEMTPRQRITTAAYAHKAELAVPIGTILPWAKNLAGVPSLWDGWVECNGQVLSDTASPLNGVSLPNLNAAAQILRGSETSGASANLTHTHDFAYWGSAVGRIQDTGSGFYTFGSSATTMSNPVAGASGNRWNFKLNEASIAGAYSVVWIMRVK